MAIINVEDAYILDETGAEVDKVTGLFTKDESTTAAEKAFAQLNIGTAGSNRNLLDNPFFQVNQRGFTSSAGANGVRSVDRWYINSGGGTGGATTLNADGTMTLTAGSNYQSFQQAIEIVPSALVGKTMTISTLLQDGTIESKSFVVPSQTSATQEIGRLSSTKYRVFVYLSATGTNTIISQVQVYAGNTITIRAVKLEVGTVSTLANDAPPDCGQELAKCQRYFYRMTSIGSAYPFEMGFATSATNFRVVLPTHCSMRTPVQSVTMNSGNFYAYGGGVAAALASVSYTGWVPNGIVVTFATSGLTQAAIYALMCNNASSYIDISCDI